MDWLFTILGIVLILVGLLDVFQTLLHPSGRGWLTWLVFKAVWRASKQLHHKLGSFTGPVAIVVIISLWAILQTVGWALIYLPHIPQGYAYSAGVFPSQYFDISEAVYVSLVTLATLGYGDIVPTDDWIRIISPLQALAGFALLTAALSWFMQIYPSLAQRRALALRLMLLHRARYARRLPRMDPVTVSRLLETLAADIVQVRIHFTQNAETYYFREASREISLPATIAYALELCEESQESQDTGLRDSAEILKGALDDLAEFLNKHFPVAGESTAEVFESFTADHGHQQDAIRMSGPAAGN